MRTLLNQLLDLSPDPWDTVVVIGARPGSNLHLVRALRPRRVVLVQGQPEQAAMLRRDIDPARGEEVLEAVVTAGGGEGTFRLHVYNIARFNSLAPPAALSQLLPNLRTIAWIEVPTRSLQRIAEDAGMDGSKRNLLVVDAPGQTSRLVEDPAALGLFSNLILVAGEEPLYDGEAGLSGLLERLGDAGFDDVASDPDAIYPLAIHALRRNGAVIKLRQLKTQFARLALERDGYVLHTRELERALASQAESAKVEAEKAKADLNQARATTEKLRAEAESLRGVLQKATSELDAARAETARAKEEAGAALAQASGERRRLDAEHEGALKAMAAERDAQAGRAGDLEAKLAAATSERDREASRAEEGLQQIGILKQQVEALEQQGGRLENALAERSDAAALAIRLQTLRENDLEDLRGRYGTLHNAHQAQRALLAKLSDRLVAANRYFQQLAASDVLEDQDTPAGRASGPPRITVESESAVPEEKPAATVKRGTGRRGGTRKAGSRGP